MEKPKPGKEDRPTPDQPAEIPKPSKKPEVKPDLPRHPQPEPQPVISPDEEPGDPSPSEIPLPTGAGKSGRLRLPVC